MEAPIRRDTKEAVNFLGLTCCARRAIGYDIQACCVDETGVLNVQALLAADTNTFGRETQAKDREWTKVNGWLLVLLLLLIAIIIIAGSPPRSSRPPPSYFSSSSSSSLLQGLRCVGQLLGGCALANNVVGVVAAVGVHFRFRRCCCSGAATALTSKEDTIPLSLVDRRFR